MLTPTCKELLDVQLFNKNIAKQIYIKHFFPTDTDLHNVIKKGNILKDIHKRYIMYQVRIIEQILHDCEKLMVQTVS
jgi:hypothetical protein